ncbi:MAG: hypothetical protein KatS3mg129_2365 [Leptospiraceae bacterium]|nr:MAG: hypothetical protein KatS3mg129_2365 [Leptospiraceae bacterium]
MKEQEIQKQNDTLKAIADSINKFTGSLTGKNLEDKLIEYSEVYGEILLYLYKTVENQKKEIKFLKKEIKQLEKLQQKPIDIKTSSKQYKFLYILVTISILSNIILIILYILK